MKPVAIQQDEITLHGHRVVYRVAGDPALPVLLLIHGITSSSATWDKVIPELAEHAYVIAPDLLGHGDSDKPRADYSLGGFASGLRDLLEYLEHDRVTVVGHSLGGGVALQFAYQYFAHCERLVLVSSGGLGREVSLALRAATLPGAEFVLPLIVNDRVREFGAAAARLLGRLPMRPRPSVGEVARGYASLADSTTRTAFVHSLRSVVEPGGQRVDASNRHYLAEGRPTLIVWGALDTIIPVRHAYETHAAIPASRLEIFEQSRHFPHRDEPDRFAQVLLQFLDETEPMQIDRAMLRERMTTRSDGSSTDLDDGSSTDLDDGSSTDVGDVGDVGDVSDVSDVSDVNDHRDDGERVGSPSDGSPSDQEEHR
jgi:pimeloyl-ACP methyl ester carboxylesterase